MKTNKIGVAALALLCTVSLSLSGCGSSQSEDPSKDASGSTSAERPAAPPEKAKPIESSLSVEGAAGEKIALDAAPQRVVCLTGICDDLLLELGMEPVATTSPDLLKDEHYMGEAKGGEVPVVKGGFGSEDVGDIASYKPDLVIGLAGVHDGLKAAVEKVAPMWNMEVQSVEDSVTYLRAMSALTGRTEEGEKAENEFYDSIRKSRETADKKGLRDVKVASMYTSSSGTGVNVRGELLGELLSHAFAYPWEGKGDDPMTAGQYSVEEILDVNPDVVFVQSFVFAPGDKTLTEQWKDNPVWQQVKAVKNNQVHEVNTGLWSMGRGPRALSLVLDEAVSTQ